MLLISLRSCAFFALIVLTGCGQRETPAFDDSSTTSRLFNIASGSASAQGSTSTLNLTWSGYSETYALQTTPNTPYPIGAFLPPGSPYNGMIYSSQNQLYPNAYDYPQPTGTPASNFSSVTLPLTNSNPDLRLYIWDGGSFVFKTALVAGTQFNFDSGGVAAFLITGMVPAEGMVTTLTYVDESDPPWDNFNLALIPVVAQ